VGTGLNALKYLAPYIFRVALSNNRLVKMEHDRVTFRYRATETGADKRCSLGAEEFIHRFLQHVLPKGFVKVRYYGFFAATHRTRLVSLQQQLGKLPVPLPTAQSQPAEDPELATPKLPCPQCGQPMLVQRTLLPTLCRSP
jgi:hypothetical protein